MKKQGINLIAQESLKRVYLAKIKKKISRISLTLVGIFVITTAITLGCFFWLNFQQKRLDTKIGSFQSQIKSVEKMESFLVTIADRIGKINSFLKTKNSYMEEVSALSLLLVPGFKLESLEIAQEKGMKISGRCESLQSLTNFNERVEEVGEKKIFSQINYSQVRRILEGKYLVELTLKK